MARAPYMHWAKSHQHGPHDLTGSNLLPVVLDELPGAADALALSGPNEEGFAPLVESIATRYGVAPGQVATAPGTSGANFLAMAAVLRPGDEVLIERPTYGPLLAVADMLGATVRRFDRAAENDFQPDPDDVVAALTPDTRLVVLTNLHNPTGVLIPEDTLREIGGRAAAVGARVHVDEVYLETAFEGSTPPAATLGDTFISTNSLTKAWGLSGLRCGWALAAPDVAEAIRRARDVVDAVGSFPSDTLANLAFGRMDRLRERAKAILVRNSKLLADVLNDATSAGIVDWVKPPGGAPIGFPRLVGTDDAARFVRWALEDFGVGVVPGRFFERPAHFRIAVGGDPAVVEPALYALAEALLAWGER
ncbi:MAG: aminotransferase class I/II-fold pyridoxal phosphate-dependent enzyme [Gemmatimonadota bacterium]